MQILTTKLSIPPLRSRLVPRLRLIQKLNQGLECGFVLVSAPAGYGKSTLLSTWLHQLDCPTAWLSLDENDNDPIRFLAYITAAFHEINPSITEEYAATPGIPSRSDIEASLTRVINGLAQVTQPFCLVLDDYHVIQDQSVHHAVNFLLEHRPQPLHLVIATRADPPLPLARLRARSCMLELRMADLRFTIQEAADFLDHTMGLKVSPEDVTRITARTEGWIAGLQMAALSMQNMDDVSGFINTFTGSHHYIFDYLLGEILAHQSPEVQHFLLTTSILDQISAPLCDALLKADADPKLKRPSSMILEELDHSNLFIIPLDDKQCWYRYHPLFAELLRGHLQKESPGQFPILHTRASIWFEEQGMISEAIRHSFAINDWERIIRLISANVFALLEQNELNSVGRQLENLTSGKSHARPWLLAGRAWLAAYTGQLNAVEPILKSAELEIDNLNSEVELQTLGGHIAAIRAYTNWIADKRDVAASAALVALEWLPADERLIRCQASTLLGLTLNDFDARLKALELALSYARECRVSHVTIFAHGCWAYLLAIKGQLHDAYTACQEAMQLAQSSSSHQSLPTLSHVYTTLSMVLLEWNDLKAAIDYSRQAVDLARRWEQADALHFALDQYGCVLFASGDMEGAFEILRQAWQVARHTSAWFEQISLSREIEWYLAMDKVDAAIHSLRLAKINIDEPISISTNVYISIFLSIIIIHIHLAQNHYSKALDLSAKLLEEVEKRKVGHFRLRLYLLQALAYYGLRQEPQSLHSLKQALLFAAPEGYLYSFVIIGPKLVPLLRKARAAGIMPEYVTELLSVIEPGTKLPAEKANIPSPLIEPLSEREMDVLKLLAQGCTDKKIAETLIIARETVHKHLKNIYGKLDVHSRVEATLRARELGLL